MIVFSNPGVIDPLAITTMGVNAKTSKSAIGIFGTGLKFAIAVLIRNGCGVHIISGGVEYTFSARPVRIRNEDFEIVQMTTRQKFSTEMTVEHTETKDLGWTTALGRNWELWQAYREVYCNCVTDEGGTVEYLPDDLVADTRPDHTIVIVTGEAFDRIHEERGEFILNPERKPFLVVPGIVEIYRGASWTVFYRGIKIGAVPGNEGARYTYNVLSWMYLSEDREMMIPSQFTEAVAKAVTSGLDLEYTEDVITVVGSDGDDRKGIEGTIDFKGATLIESVFAVVKRVIEDTKKKASHTIIGGFRDYEREHLLSRRVDISSQERYDLDAAIRACATIGFNFPGKIGVVAELGAGIDVTGKDDTILLAVELVQGDGDKLRTTLAMQIAEMQLKLKPDTVNFSRALIQQMFVLVHPARAGDGVHGTNGYEEPRRPLSMEERAVDPETQESRA